MALPQPGKKVRGSHSGAPTNAIFDLLGRRWALGIIWNLDKKPLTFRELQDICGGISPSILNSRIKELKESGLLERTLEGYTLTPRGAELRKTLIPLVTWSIHWAEEVFGYHKNLPPEHQNHHIPDPEAPQ